MLCSIQLGAPWLWLTRKRLTLVVEKEEGRMDDRQICLFKCLPVQATALPAVLKKLTEKLATPNAPSTVVFIPSYKNTLNSELVIGYKSKR